MKKMRIVGWFFLTLFILVGAVVSFFETSQGDRLVQKLLFRSLKEAGVEVSAESFTGYFPEEIELKGVRVQNSFSIDSVRLRVSLWSLLKKEPKIKGLAKIGKVETLFPSLPWKGAAELSFWMAGTLESYKGGFKAVGSTYTIEGKVQKKRGEGPVFQEVDLHTEELEATGTVFLSPDYQLTQALFALDAFGKDLEVTGQLSKEAPGFSGKGEIHSPLFALEGSWKGLWQEGVGSCSIEAFGKIAEEPSSFAADLTYRQADRSFVFHQLEINSPFLAARATGNLMELNALSLQITKGRYKELKVDRALFTTSYNESFAFAARGELREPFQWDMAGSWEWKKGSFSLAVEEAKGSLLSHPILLQKPLFIQWEGDQFSCAPTLVSIGEKGEISLQVEQKTASCSLKQVPLDLLSVNALQTPVRGIIDLEASVNEGRGSCRGEIHRLQIGDQKQSAEGQFEAALDRRELSVRLELATALQPLCNLTAILPLEVNSSPWRAAWLLDKPAQGHLTMHTDLEEVLDFFNLGTHRLEGEWKCDLTLKNTLAHPEIEGRCSLANGTYENYFTGTSLCGIQAEFAASGNEVNLVSLTAQNGDLSGFGHLRLEGENHFPFVLNLEFEKLPIAELDLVTAEAEGELSIRGNSEGAKAKGHIQIKEARVSIPEKIRRPLPDLQVVYTNGAPVALPTSKEKDHYPLLLDLSLVIPDSLFVGGKGLSSEWKGDLVIGGTYPSVAATGKLELLSGEFVFSGRSFKLVDGTLLFTGKEGQMPLLDLSANTFEKGVSITARLQGPLNQPQVTFQSSPPLSFSSILSYLLFGQDLSEIDGFQAIQLATSTASLAGETPDILEGTRRSLGIDRIRILSTTKGAEEGEELAIQVGKYVAKGVIVSFSQGADETSSNVSIEVDLKHGFIFQAETDQQQEQGKFTLKWNLNY